MFLVAVPLINLSNFKISIDIFFGIAEIRIWVLWVGSKDAIHCAMRLLIFLAIWFRAKTFAMTGKTHVGKNLITITISQDSNPAHSWSLRRVSLMSTTPSKVTWLQPCSPASPNGGKDGEVSFSRNSTSDSTLGLAAAAANKHKHVGGR